MNVFSYDKTFDGLLSVVFDAYRLKMFPEMLLGEGDIEPLFMVKKHVSVTDLSKSNRVWEALKNRLSHRALNHVLYVWQSEQEGSDILIFNYIRKVIDSPKPIETDFTDIVVSNMIKVARKVGNDRMHLIQFARFQQTKEGCFSLLLPQTLTCCQWQYPILPIASRTGRGQYTTFVDSMVFIMT